MPNRSEKGRSANPPPIFAHVEGKRTSAVRQSRSSRRSKLLWPVLCGLTLAFLAGGLAFLWPILKMAGLEVALVVVVAVILSSLIPLLLLRRILRSAPAPEGEETSEGEEIP